MAAPNKDVEMLDMGNPPLPPTLVSKRAMKCLRKRTGMMITLETATEFFVALGRKKKITIENVENLTEAQVDQLRNWISTTSNTSSSSASATPNTSSGSVAPNTSSASTAPNTSSASTAPSTSSSSAATNRRRPMPPPPIISTRTSAPFQQKYPASYYNCCLEQEDFDQLNQMVALLDWSAFSKLQMKHKNIKDNDANDVVAVGRVRRNSIHLDDDESEARMLAMRKEIKQEEEDDDVILLT